MIKELLEILRGEDAEALLRERLSEMLELSQTLVRQAGECLFERQRGALDVPAFYELDRRINEIEQEIRKYLVGRLELSTATERARFLLVVGLAKDVERIGDYAKNLLEAANMLASLPTESPVTVELAEIRDAVEASLEGTKTVLMNATEDEAHELVEQGHGVARRCEQLVRALAASELPAATAVPLALAARHYKRIQKHLTNALSTLTRPLHKVGYYA